jgi:hypothetical protein
MIVCTLATTDCRDGNCPTAWLTDRGTVVVQGYATSRGEVVEVPEHILLRAAAELLASNAAAALAMPGPRSSCEAPDVWLTSSGYFAVRGDATTSDVVTLHVPEGEGAVDVGAGVIIREASRISALKEAV